MLYKNNIECVGVEKIDTSVLSELKANIDNFEQSSCADTKYLDAINSIIKIPSRAPISQINQFDILTDAISEIKDGSLRSNQDLCRQKVAKVKKNLNFLSPKEEVTSSQKNTPAKGTR